MPNAPSNQAIVVGALNPVENKIFEVPTHPEANEKEIVAVDAAARTETDATLEEKISGVPPSANAASDDANDDANDEEKKDNVIILTGADAARYLLPCK